MNGSNAPVLDKPAPGIVIRTPNAIDINGGDISKIAEIYTVGIEGTRNRGGRCVMSAPTWAGPKIDPVEAYKVWNCSYREGDRHNWDLGVLQNPNYVGS